MRLSAPHQEPLAAPSDPVVVQPVPPTTVHANPAVLAYHGDVPVEARLLKLTEEVGEVAEAYIEFPACDAANDPATPDGLTWAELVTVTTAALRAGGCRGCSIGVYNTDLDPGGDTATRIVAFFADVAAYAWPG